jgi:hypothetical protein
MELMTTNVDAAKEFYSKLFSWETEDASMPGMSYLVIKTKGDSAGGITALLPEMQGMPPMWGIYVTVDDVDATAKKVEELGGKIVRPPTDIPDTGRFCVLSDPHGAVISAMTWVSEEP